MQAPKRRLYLCSEVAERIITQWTILCDCFRLSDNLFSKTFSIFTTSIQYRADYWSHDVFARRCCPVSRISEVMKYSYSRFYLFAIIIRNRLSSDHEKRLGCHEHRVTTEHTNFIRAG